jgi:hypothetical protein
MMNSTIDGDEFGENPFRSGDAFYDSSDPLQQQQQQQQQQQPQFQPSFQPQPGGQDQFQAQAQQQQLPMMMNPAASSSYPLPSGPMDQNNNNMMAPAGLMATTATQRQQQQQQPPIPPANPTSWWGNCVMCLSIDSYKAYFDVDADDIVSRIRSVFLTFYKPDHFRTNVLGTTKAGDLKGPDLYGPFWITMTLIFFIGVSVLGGVVSCHVMSCHVMSCHVTRCGASCFVSFWFVCVTFGSYEWVTVSDDELRCLLLDLDLLLRVRKETSLTFWIFQSH